ncbi:hypothetical protein DFH06DRAFT_1175129 [Mycena polygramma]|nr:hypothetical protein DFH06DRAFT_1175129 [Mycena polygramma]
MASSVIIMATLFCSLDLLVCLRLGIASGARLTAPLSPHVPATKSTGFSVFISNVEKIGTDPVQQRFSPFRLSTQSIVLHGPGIAFRASRSATYHQRIPRLQKSTR